LAELQKVLSSFNTPGIRVDEVERIIQAALDAANPYRLVLDNLRVNKNKIKVGRKLFALSSSSRVILIGLGKASLLMTQAAVKQLGNLVNDGVCVCKHIPEHEPDLRGICIIRGQHPIPDEKSVLAGQAIREVVTGLKKEDLVIVLLSGGGSALASIPAGEITIEDYKEVTTFFLKSGASIQEINTVRKHIDLIKGGGLLRMAAPARVGVLVLSDVVGSPLEIIASGPAIADSSTYHDALNVIKKYSPDFNGIPKQIKKCLDAGAEQEQRETGNLKNEESRVAYHTIIGSNVISAQASAQEARRFGFNPKIITCNLVGEAKSAGKYLVEQLRESCLQKPFVLIAGGETTVVVEGKGLGGRNLEMALSSVEGMAKQDKCLLVTLATDGEDGPTDAAGAIVNEHTFRNAQRLGLSVQEHLDRNDSYHFFQQTGGLIRIGPTGTNVNDLAFLFAF
jgi:glycerate 2-kinase